MDLISSYVECYNRFCRYIIDNKIADINEEELFLFLQNNLRESLGKSKMSRYCKANIKSGKRAGEECGKTIKGEGDFCKVHTKKEEVKKEENIVEEDILIIRKNKYNNFVYGNTGLIFKSSLEKYIVAKEGMNGEWLPLDEIDIDLCKEYNLKWKIIPNKFKGEITNIDVIKKYDCFPTKEELQENKIHFKYLNMDEEFNEN